MKPNIRTSIAENLVPDAARCENAPQDVRVSPKSKSNLVAYGILCGVCFTVAFIAAVRPQLFAHGPPSFRLFLSIRGTAVIALLGLIGIFFLNRSTLRGLWDGDLTAREKLLTPLAAGFVLGGLNVLLRRSEGRRVGTEGIW